LEDENEFKEDWKIMKMLEIFWIMVKRRSPTIILLMKSTISWMSLLRMCNISDEPVEDVDPQLNMEYELDSSNVEVDLVIGKTCNL